MSIEVRHIHKTFGSFAALKDVSLHIDDGKLVALLGPSGSGKTTLLRIIAGLESPDPSPDSVVLFDEENVARRPVRGRGVGFVFQHYALFRHMSVFENVAFGLRVKPRRERPCKAEIADRVLRLLKLVQLDSLAERYPSQLSGGQRQRIALARALAVEPRVLLLDEPFGALDAQVRQELRQWLRRLHDELHVTSVFVTHDQEEALEVADRVVVMNHGQVVQEGTPEEVFHHPASEFVVRFLGRVNVFHGRAAAGQVHFSSVALDLPDSDQTGSRPARVFVRPHEWDIETHVNGDPCCRAVVRHVNPAGAQTRLSMTTDGGEPVEVEVPYERFLELAIGVGDAVFLVPRRVKVFVDGQAVDTEPAGSEEKRQASRLHLETGP